VTVEIAPCAGAWIETSNNKQITQRREGVVKKLILLFAVLVSVLLIVSSCGKTGAPNCADEDVKSLVIQITEGELRNEFLNQAIMTELHMAPHILGNPTYNGLNNLKEKNNDVVKLLGIVDKRMADTKIELTAIRTNGKDDKIKKCECGGDISINGKSGSIEFTGQYTEDGQIYVEVFGL